MHWCPVALGVVFLLSLGYLQRERALKGQNDFVQLYAGARLAGTPDLYSRSANLALIKSIQGFTMDTVVYTRPPFYAALLRPLAALPYHVAYAIFSFLTLGSILWFVIRFSKECPSLPFFAAMSIPLLTALCNGQDTPFLLAILGGSILLTRRRMEFLGGAGTLAMRHQVSLVPISPHSSIGQKALAYFGRSFQRRRTSCGIGRACERDGFDLAVRAGSAGSMDQPERDRNAESSRSGRRLAWRYTAGNVARRWRFADIPVDYPAQ